MDFKALMASIKKVNTVVSKNSPNSHFFEDNLIRSLEEIDRAFEQIKNQMDQSFMEATQYDYSQLDVGIVTYKHQKITASTVEKTLEKVEEKPIPSGIELWDE